MIYISSNTMKCFAFREYRHFRGSCPNTEQGGRPSWVKNIAGGAPTPTGPVADLPPGPVVDSQTPGPSSAGAQGVVQVAG